MMKSGRRKVFLGLGFLLVYGLVGALSWIDCLPGVYDPLVSDFTLQDYPSPPSKKHIFGTDDRGRDVLSRLVHGIKYSLFFSMLVWFFSYGLGIFLGALMGYFGGIVDLVGQRIVEVFETVPYLFVIMLVVSSLGKSILILVMVNVLMGWMMISSYMRAQVLKEKQSPSVEAVLALGASPLRVIWAHVLPSSMLPVLVFSPLALASYTATLVQLDFLGVGLQPPTPSWGELFLQANQNFPEAWWLLVFPMIFTVGILLSFQLVASGLKVSR